MAAMETAEDSGLSVPELAKLIDDIKAIDTDARLASIRVLKQIATALGPKRTREELVPYLTDSIDDEDDVMALLATELVSLIPCIGGADHAHLLLPALETLASSEEAVVRKNATESLNTIALAMSRDTVLDKYVPLVDRLTSAHWYNLRASACALYPTLYKIVGDEQFKSNVVQAYATLCKDSTPMVRREAAVHLKAMLECCSAAEVNKTLKELFLAFMDDTQDSVRLHGVGLLPALAASLGKAEHAAIIVPNFERGVRDEAWRVRYMLASSLIDLQAAVSVDVRHANLLPAFVKLLSDPEAEVRNCAASKVFDFCLNLSDKTRVKDFCRDILPCVSKLAEDEEEHVRASLATVIMGLSSIVGRELTIEHLLPIFLRLLKDSSSQVRLNVISRLSEVNKVIGLEHLAQKLLPAIDDLAENDDWRTRLAIIEYLPVVSEQLGVDFYNTHLMKLCIMWLKDSVYAVRKSAVENLSRLVKTFGKKWAHNVIVPEVMAMAKNEVFTHRMTCLFASNVLMEAVSPETTMELLLPVACDLHTDKIPNIRLNVAKTLALLIDTLKGERSSEAKMRPVLDKLQSDNDPDVKFFAEQALSKLDSFV